MASPNFRQRFSGGIFSVDFVSDKKRQIHCASSAIPDSDLAELGNNCFQTFQMVHLEVSTSAVLWGLESRAKEAWGCLMAQAQRWMREGMERNEIVQVFLEALEALKNGGAISSGGEIMVHNSYFLCASSPVITFTGTASEPESSVDTDYIALPSALCLPLSARSQAAWTTWFTPPRNTAAPVNGATAGTGTHQSLRAGLAPFLGFWLAVSSSLQCGWTPAFLMRLCWGSDGPKHSVNLAAPWRLRGELPDRCFLGRDTFTEAVTLSSLWLWPRSLTWEVLALTQCWAENEWDLKACQWAYHFGGLQASHKGDKMIMKHSCPRA